MSTKWSLTRSGRYERVDCSECYDLRDLQKDRHQKDIKFCCSYCSLLQLREHYTLVLLLGNTNSSSLATSCLGVLSTHTQTVNRKSVLNSFACISEGCSTDIN